MTVFDHYACYYDLLYRDKDYSAEAEYIVKLIGEHAPDARNVLEMGCGTGAHAALLAAKGYLVHGIDMSANMLARAKERRSQLSAELAGRLSFAQGDVRSYRSDERFDVVLSLFHVFSYQTTNEDLAAAFATAATHLKLGGVMIVDFWYGPAVLSQQPETRVKRLEDDAVRVTRIAEPAIHPNENVVDVNYEVWVEDKRTGEIQRLKELHRMRYLFAPEIASHLDKHGFESSDLYEWLTCEPPRLSSWSGCVVAKK